MAGGRLQPDGEPVDTAGLDLLVEADGDRRPRCWVVRERCRIFRGHFQVAAVQARWQVAEAVDDQLELGQDGRTVAVLKTD